MNKEQQTNTRLPKPFKKHASHQNHTSLNKHTITEDTLLPEAFEFLGSAGKLKAQFGTTSLDAPVLLTQRLITKIEHYCIGIDQSTANHIENILSDFGEYLLLHGSEESKNETNTDAYRLLKQLYTARNQQAFFQGVIEIHQFCSRISS